MESGLTISESENGVTIVTQKYLAFFGSRLVDETKLVQLFPNIEFRRIRQTHSDICVPSRDEYRFGVESVIPEADAHYTSERNVGLVIRTADCLPVMVYIENQDGKRADQNIETVHGVHTAVETNVVGKIEKSKSVVFAIHAGWKGVANQITPKSLRNQMSFQQTQNVFELSPSGFQAPPLEVLIGPHIQKNSFEVQEPTTKEILSSVPHASPFYEYNMETGKSYIDLGALVYQQLKDFEIQTFWTSKHDTKTNQNFHSYRRDGKSSGRNLSFICLLT